MKTTEWKFWSTLKTTRGWQLGPHNVIRKAEKDGTTICPVCAVANKLLGLRGNKRFTENYGRAASAIGFSDPVATKIAIAADNAYGTEAPLRIKLLKTTRIEDAS